MTSSRGGGSPNYSPSALVLRVLLENADLRKGLDCLDLGSGASLLPVRLAQHGCRVTAVDLRETGLDRLRCGTGSLERLQLDARDMRQLQNGSFDRVVMSLLAPSLSVGGLDLVWGEIRRVIRSSGSVSALDLHPCSKLRLDLPWRRHTHPPRHYWTREDVEALVTTATGSQAIRYKHHSLADLLGAPIDAGMRLVGLKEFPKVWLGERTLVPGYLLTKWSAS